MSPTIPAEEHRLGNMTWRIRPRGPPQNFRLMHKTAKRNPCLMTAPKSIGKVRASPLEPLAALGDCLCFSQDIAS